MASSFSRACASISYNSLAARVDIQMSSKKEGETERVCTLFHKHEDCLPTDEASSPSRMMSNPSGEERHANIRSQGLPEAALVQRKSRKGGKAGRTNRVRRRGVRDVR